MRVITRMNFLRTMRVIGVAGLPALASLGGCAERGTVGDSVGGPGLAIEVAPLTLDGVTDAVWTIAVTTNGTANPVWSRQVRSSAFGDGRGSVSYVGPCDASAGTNRVTLTLDALEVNGTPITDYVNPTPVFRDATCSPNSDTPVQFNLTLARQANQGFFDVAVNFEDVFCSAKLDCKKDGQPLDLLFNGDERDTTVVVAFACTSGANQPTFLHMDALTLSCTDSLSGQTTTMSHIPSRGPGNQGPIAPYLFETASYRVKESLAPYEKCAWNHALGVNLAAIPATTDCTLTGRATASQAPWLAGLSPDGVVHPYIAWNVKVIDDGALSCNQHPLNVEGSGVTTDYIRNGQERFAYTMACTSELNATINGDVCGGTIAGFNDEVVFAETNQGVVVSVGGTVTQPMRLPDGVTLEGCCLDPCCTTN